MSYWISRKVDFVFTLPSSGTHLLLVKTHSERFLTSPYRAGIANQGSSRAMVSKLRPGGWMWLFACLYLALWALFHHFTPMMGNHSLYWHHKWGTTSPTKINDGEHPLATVRPHQSLKHSKLALCLDSLETPCST